MKHYNAKRYEDHSLFTYILKKTFLQFTRWGHCGLTWFIDEQRAVVNVTKATGLKQDRLMTSLFKCKLVSYFLQNINQQTYDKMSVCAQE